jgi:hypothetical protein
MVRDYCSLVPRDATDVVADGRALSVSNPSKVLFSARGETKLDLVNYYVAVGAGALVGVRERPTVLKRFPNGDHHYSLGPLLELAARDEAGGLGDAPWPPHFAKQRGEPSRVQPSRARPAPEATSRARPAPEATSRARPAPEATSRARKQS